MFFPCQYVCRGQNRPITSHIITLHRRKMGQRKVMLLLLFPYQLVLVTFQFVT